SSALFTSSVELHKRIQALWPEVSDRGRLADWYQQVYRSSLSVVRNSCESFGKGKGWTVNSMLGARAEASGTSGALTAAEIQGAVDLLPLAKQVIEELNTVIARLI